MHTDEHEALLQLMHLASRIVGVVRGDNGDVEILPERSDIPHHRLLYIETVVHDFEIVILPEYVLHPRGDATRPVIVVVQEEVRHLPDDTGRGSDKSLMAFLEQIVIDTGLVVVAVLVGFLR